MLIRQWCAIIAINDNKIALLGGFKKSDGVEIDLSRKTVRQTNDFGGIEKASQTVKVGANEFISLGAAKT